MCPTQPSPVLAASRYVPPGSGEPHRVIGGYDEPAPMPLPPAPSTGPGRTLGTDSVLAAVGQQALPRASTVVDRRSRGAWPPPHPFRRALPIGSRARALGSAAAGLAAAPSPETGRTSLEWVPLLARSSITATCPRCRCPLRPVRQLLGMRPGTPRAASQMALWTGSPRAVGAVCCLPFLDVD